MYSTAYSPAKLKPEPPAKHRLPTVTSPVPGRRHCPDPAGPRERVAALIFCGTPNRASGAQNLRLLRVAPAVTAWGQKCTKVADQKPLPMSNGRARPHRQQTQTQPKAYWRHGCRIVMCTEGRRAGTPRIGPTNRHTGAFDQATQL